MEDVGYLGADPSHPLQGHLGLFSHSHRDTGGCHEDVGYTGSHLTDQRSLCGDRALLSEPRKGGMVPGSLIKDIPDEVLTKTSSLGTVPAAARQRPNRNPENLLAKGV